jgi:integrase
VRRRLKFAFTTGLRKSSVSRIKIGDVRLERREILIRDPKNGEDRVTHLSAPAYAAVHEQIQCRMRNSAGPDDYLFPGRKKDEPMRDIRGGLDGALKRARLPHIRVHDMRATFASLLAAGGADVKSLCDAMGWKDLNSAKPYLATVREAMKRHVDNVGKMLT